MKSSNRGFTLIELLVVIAIISLLMVALLPNILGANVEANMVADKATLRWHYDAIQRYKNRMKHYPTKGGHKFVMAPWVDDFVEKSPENRDRYFSANVSADAYRDELKSREVKDLWKTYDDVTSEDTHFAGRARRFMKGNLIKQNEIWMATDNEGFPIYENAVIALYGGGNMRELLRQKQLKEWWPEEPEEGWAFPVGPESPHPDLRKLDY